MTLAGVLLMLGLVATGFLAAVAGLWALAWLARDAANPGPQPDRTTARVFLFRDDVLSDATDRARQMLDKAAPIGSDWQMLGQALAGAGVDLDRMRDDALAHGTAVQESPEGGFRVSAIPQLDALRVTIDDLETGEGAVPVDRLSLAAMTYELQTLRSLADGVPWLIWREAPDAENSTRRVINWANSAYIDLAERRAGGAIGWPPPALFDTAPLHDDQTGPRRLALRDTARSAEDWYLCSARRDGADLVCTAVAAAREVAAQAALGDLRQTLAQTLECLPTGLAIFDRDRLLTLANASLIRMLDLPEPFIAATPDLDEFLDHLRHSRRLPEPRDYRRWRQQVSRGEDDSGSPGYRATWTLPCGDTLRVAAHVRGDDALVLMVDDLTGDMSLTRRFRAELDLGQSVLDHMDEALAVFDADGVLCLSNAAYDRRWQSDPRVSLGDLTLADALERWRGHCAETSAWADLRHFANQKHRSAWTAGLRLHGGGALRMRVAPLAGGALLIGFRALHQQLHPVDPAPASASSGMRAAI